MIEIFTPSEMKMIDEFAIRTIGVPSLQLMENAGKACVEELMRLIPAQKKRVIIFCGKGNNGGDGFVIARLLALHGWSVIVVLLGQASTFTPDALHCFHQLRETTVAVYSFRQFQSQNDHSFDIIIDAIFGTSFRGSVRGKYREAVRWINEQNDSLVLAVDIPSGLNGETGVVGSEAVSADATVTFSNPKTGFFFRDARDYTGTLIVKDIGIPAGALKRYSSNVFWTETSDCKQLLPVRSSNSHKHSVGKIFAIAGSKGMMGAALLSSISAMKSGAGQVILGMPETEYPIAAKRTLEVMPLGFQSTREGTLALDAFNDLRSRMDWANVVALGPGLSRNPETQSLIRKLVRTCTKPLVIDADALTAIADDIKILTKSKSKEIILTPHHGEFARLISVESGEIEERKIELARSFAEQYHVTLVLKGAPTIVATASGNVFVNSTGNPGMSTAGSGDVLCGIISALAGQGLSGEGAAILGVYLHGSAGDYAQKKQGTFGMIASDILKNIPAAFKKLEQ